MLPSVDGFDCALHKLKVGATISKNSRKETRRNSTHLCHLLMRSSKSACSNGHSYPQFYSHVLNEKSAHALLQLAYRTQKAAFFQIPSQVKRKRLRQTPWHVQFVFPCNRQPVSQAAALLAHTENPLQLRFRFKNSSSGAPSVNDLVKWRSLHITIRRIVRQTTSTSGM